MSDDRAARMAGRFGGDDEPDQEAEPEAPQEAPPEDDPEPDQEDDQEAPQEDHSTENVTDNPVIQIYDASGKKEDLGDLFRDIEYVYNRKLDREFGKHSDFYTALLEAGMNHIFEELDVDEDEVPRL